MNVAYADNHIKTIDTFYGHNQFCFIVQVRDTFSTTSS